MTRLTADCLRLFFVFRRRGIQNGHALFKQSAETAKFRPAAKQKKRVDGRRVLLSLTISNPPTKAEVEAIRDKINEMLTVMFR